MHDRRCNNLQWSRYLLLRREGEINTVPAVNILTQRARVKPYNMVDLSTGFKFKKDTTEVEIGYDLWAKHSERVTPLRPCCASLPFPITEYGIAGTATSSANESTITTLAEDDPEFVHLKERDLNFHSAASRGGFTNRIHAAAGYTYCGESHDIFFGGGIFYEHPHTNIALENWGLWFKFVDEF